MATLKIHFESSLNLLFFEDDILKLFPAYIVQKYQNEKNINILLWKESKN